MFFLKKRRVEIQKPGRVICSMGQARFRVFRQSDNMFGCLVCVRSSTHQSIIAGPAYEQEQPPKKKKKNRNSQGKEMERVLVLLIVHQDRIHAYSYAVAAWLVDSHWL